MTLSRVFLTTLLVAVVPSVVVGLLDPIGGRVLSAGNVAFVVTTPLATAAILVAAAAAGGRSVTCYRCGSSCSFSHYHSECGAKRWVCPKCRSLRTKHGGPA